MENASFDDLLQALQSAYVDAQDSLKKKRQEVLERRNEAVESEGGQGSCLTFAIPQSGGAEDRHELLILPILSFRRPRSPQVAMLSLSFECELEKIGFPGASRAIRVVIAPETKRSGWGKKRRRMQIVFHGTEQPWGEVRLDGKMLMSIPANAGAEGGSSASGAKPSLLARVYRMFRKLWPQHGFAMTAEQSKRVRQMLAQLDAGGMPRGEAAL